MTTPVALVREIADRRGLPVPALAAAEHGTASLRVQGWYPLDDLLCWAGEMAGDPWWWTVISPEGTCRDVFAAGLVDGLAVSVVARTEQPLPPAPGTEDVLAAAALERERLAPPARASGLSADTGPLPAPAPARPCPVTARLRGMRRVLLVVALAALSLTGAASAALGLGSVLFALVYLPWGPA